MRFTAYPNQLHPNEVRAENERLLSIAEERSENDKRKNRFLGDGVDSDTEETSKSLIDASNKKSRTGEKEIPTLVGMDIDQSETQSDTSTSKGQETSTATSFRLPTNSELEKASKDELIDLINRVKSELERREKQVKESQGSNTINYEISTKELKDGLSKAESRINSFQTSNTADVNNDNKSSNAGVVVAVVGVVSALAIGVIALAKSKLGRSKKK